MNEWLVRVVAGNAGQARIAVAPATAVFQTVRLKARVGDASNAYLIDVGPGAMAGAAEIDESDGTEPVRIENSGPTLLVLFLAHQAHMLCARSVTCFASHTGHRV